MGHEVCGKSHSNSLSICCQPKTDLKNNNKKWPKASKDKENLAEVKSEINLHTRLQVQNQIF